MHSLISRKRPKSSHKLKMCDDNDEETTLGIRAPIVGYEVVDKREKFTVYKIQVKNQGKSWFVFRRYTDFVRLNDKLQDAFPGFHLKLPSKRLFKNNFDPEFIEERAHGLQFFINNIMRHSAICRSSILKEFLCLDDPPGPFDSLEESRAYCQQLEDEIEDMKERMMEMQSELSATKSQLAQARVQQESLVQSLKEERASNSLQKQSTGDIPASFKSLSHSEGREKDGSENCWTENVAGTAHSKSVNPVKPLARRRILTSTPDKNTDYATLENDDNLTKLTQDIEKDDSLNTTLDDADTTLNSSTSAVKENVVELNETSSFGPEQKYNVDGSDDQLADIHDDGSRSKSRQSSKRDSGIVADTGMSPLPT